MASMAALATKKYRRLVKSGLDPDRAFDRVASWAGAVASWNETERNTDRTVVSFPLEYPIRSSVGLLFPDDSALIFGGGLVWVSRLANPSKDAMVYRYMDDLIPIVPIGRYRHVPYSTRYSFTELEQRLVDEATRILDVLLLYEQGLQLPVWMRWFPSDRLLVKNLISAGGDANAVCSLLLGMLADGRLTVLETASDENYDSVVTIRHQSVP